MKPLMFCLSALSLLAAAPAVAGPAEVGDSLASPVSGMMGGCKAGIVAGESAGLGPLTLVTALVGCAAGTVVGTVKGVVTLPVAVLN